MPRVSLNPVTIGNPDLPTACAVAAAAGYPGIAVRYDRLEAYLDDGRTIDDARLLVADAGLEISEVGFLAEWQFYGGLPLVAQRSRQNVVTDPALLRDRLHRFFERCAGLGVRHVTAAATWNRPGTVEEGAADFARLCALAAPYGLDVGFEFFGNALCCSRIADAARLVQLAAAPNGGLLLDTFLSYLGGSPPEDLATCRELGVALHAVHIADARPGDPRGLDILSGRALPGRGVLPLGRVLATLRALDYDGWLAVEVFNAAMTPDAARRTAELALEATTEMMDTAWAVPTRGGTRRG